jgi:predicted enzyme related to lactoylglutathione lyase
MEHSRHLPGTFCWPELATTDRAAGVAFYRELFGWTVDDQPIGPDDVYSIFRLHGREAGACYSMRDDERGMGIPSHWNSYIAVASADEAVERAQTLGATVLVPPFDVMDNGRMAVLQDPTGATFQVWQAAKSIGAHVLAEPGALCWTELTTSDPAAAEAFYTALFGWSAKHSTGGPTPYTEFTVRGADHPSVGMMQKPPHLPPDVPSFWLPYFEVTDVDGTASNAQALGGSIHFGPQDIPGTGRFAVLADPQGAAFAAYAPQRR